MSGRGKKAAAPRKRANKYKMPAPIANGEVIHDTIMKKKWRIGPSIGVGGFGEIYSACDHESSPKKSNYPFVIKIEPHENGPLFVEKHFYVRNANKENIAKFMNERKLSTFGMPTYFGNGSHEYKGEKYRYLVLERYGKDLWSIFLENGRSFPPTTVFQIGLQMLDVLQYIHSRGYVHADIKGANILLGLKKGTENQAYLVDFGLATRVTEKEFKPDPKCAHNGTIEYTSRDAHLGVPTMRGDLEILGYNLLQWLGGKLPWETALKQPKAVQELKETFMKSVRSSIAKQYSHVPEALTKFFEYINTLKPKDVPDYAKCRQLFEGYLKSEGKTRTSKLDLTLGKKLKSKSLEINGDSEGNSSKSPKKRTAKPASETKAKTSRKLAEDTSEGESEEEGDDNSDIEEVNTTKSPKKRPSNQEVKIKKVKRSAKESSEGDNCENEEPEAGVGQKKTINKRQKRKSSEPAFLVRVKKTKLTPRSTPPAKKNHANIATQTSSSKTRRSPRQVSFDSPICEVIGDKNSKSVNSSGDIFDDSFVIEEKKVKRKRKLLSTQEVIVKRVVKKKTTAVDKPKQKSWKDAPTVLNGRSPPK